MPYDMRKLSLLVGLATFLLVLVFLYWTRVVLMPMAVAILLTFVLDPVVSLLQRARLPRMPAVILVVVVAFAFLGSIGWVVTGQLTSLANELPQHTENLRHKLADLRGMSRGGVIEKIQRTLEEVLREPPPATAPRPSRPPETAPEQPVPVVVQAPSVLWSLPSLLEPLATAGLVLVLVIFMLLKHSDLRNRLIRLAGYGLGVGLGVFLIGVPYALLWGFLAAVLRFIPYVGPGLAALLPCALSLVVFPGWWQ